MLARYCRYWIILAAVFAIPLPPRATPRARFPAGSGPDSKRAHDASGSALRRRKDHFMDGEDGRLPIAWAAPVRQAAPHLPARSSGRAEKCRCFIN